MQICKFIEMLEALHKEYGDDCYVCIHQKGEKGAVGDSHLVFAAPTGVYDAKPAPRKTEREAGGCYCTNRLKYVELANRSVQPKPGLVRCLVISAC